jgi:orotate phosphoribosyltransferase
MVNAREELVKLLADKAFLEGKLTLASGRSSSVYLDAKQVTYHPDGCALVGRAVLDRIRDLDVIGVGGLTMGADAVIASTIWSARLEGTRLYGFVVRKDSKAHGLRKQVEGVSLDSGSRVAIVDDVVTSGGSALKAVDAAEAKGLNVVVVVPLVDRQEGAEAAVTSRGLEFRPVCTLEEVRAARGALAHSSTGR